MNSSTVPLDVEEEHKLSLFLIDQVVKKCSGQLSSTCTYNKPSDTYFIGNLRPAPVDEESYTKEILQKLSPSAFGGEFKLAVNEDLVSINVTLNWTCYYRVFPDLDEQTQWMLERGKKIEKPVIERAKVVKEEDSLGDTTLKGSFVQRQLERRSSEELFVKYEKVDGSVNGKIELHMLKGNWTIDTKSLKDALENEFRRITALILNNPKRIRTQGQNTKIRITDNELANEQKYEAAISNFTNEVEHKWQWDVIVQRIALSSAEPHLHLMLQFVNTSMDDTSNPNFEPFIFSAVAEFDFTGATVVPFDLELAPDSFRYNRELVGKGFNCGLRALSGKSGVKFITTHTPTYSQSRYMTKEQPRAFFKDLVSDPIPVLKEILKAMEMEIKNWELARENYARIFGPKWTSVYEQQYRTDENSFRKEIAAFQNGLKLIESDDEIRLAFNLTNRTFEKAGYNTNPNKAKVKWRLFQIVFLVAQVPSVAALSPKHSKYRNEREIVDIIYFPTGGGKTEAYLSALVLNSFYDRIRGKKAGVTSWIRFPLRLLTVQQTQRLTDIIGTAELVRSEMASDNLSLRGVPFSVGYFVGKGSTPNRIAANDNNWEDKHNWSIAHDDIKRQEWKRVFSCPSCKTSNVRVEFDDQSLKLLHRCQESTCKFPNGILPIYIVDDEVYRYLPTVVVGTIDKLAGIGNQRLFSMIFGKVDGFCKKHGFYNGECIRKWEKNCGNDIVNKPIAGLTGPSLFIQDELHLLKEGLGTFDSHYETFAQYLIKELSGDMPLKIIASSATIEEYERQVRHLYGRHNTRMFPGLGPTLRENFYAETLTFPQRIFVGILPHNKTIFNAILEVIEAYHCSIDYLKKVKVGEPNPYGGTYACASTEWKKLIDKYRTSLTYFLAGRELDSVKTDIQHYINPKFLRDSIEPIAVKELTGGISTDSVTQTLSLLEHEHDFTESEEAVLATSMISHGVDIDRMNAMIFYGMPRQNAEYIQASSRVGRKHIGIVFNCLHPIRERDQSHFAYFEKYHEFIGQLVEPVAINRWSTYSIDRTLPGLFMAALLQVVANRGSQDSRWKYGKLDALGRMFSQGEIQEDELRKIIKEGYQVNTTLEPRDVLFDRKIDEVVVNYIDSIKRGSNIHKWVSDVLSPGPMTSLRDVDESITIELDSSGTDWMRKKRTK